ncbi:hypothetical protein KSW81_006991 [Nannochloris sp. 'desiccata']|nr:hypothetical protein KSW81_006991 [Chlorella desiccata (nom. nud.)]
MAIALQTRVAGSVLRAAFAEVATRVYISHINDPKMTSITCSTQPFLGLSGFFKKTTVPQTPVAPSLGSLGVRAPQRPQQHVGALSINSDDMQPQGNFFSAFVQPDVPADRKVQAPRPAVPISVVKPDDDDETDFQTKLGKPRFRSALEQVSYLTNEQRIRRY